jgi:hypothetical protein
MKAYRKRSFLDGLLVSSCLSLLMWAGPVTSASGPENAATMPKQCRPGKTSTESFGWRWRPGARVRVYYLKGDFGAQETAALARAVGNWDNALREIDSRVAFVNGGERDGVSGDDASITVMRGVPKGKDRLGQLKLYSMSNGVMRATMIVSPAVTDLDALTSLMAHELGHSLGLGDCYGCKRGTTTMSAFKDVNEGNDVYSPSECDKYVVALGYAGAAGSEPSVVPAAER